MPKLLHKIGWKRGCGSVAASLALCCLSTSIFAQESPLEATSGTFIPFPLAHQPGSESLPLGLGEENVRQLQLQLNESLSAQAFSMMGLSDNQTSTQAVGGGLNYQIDEQLSLNGGAGLESSQSSFTSLGSIHCVNGTLDAVSYRASNCYFIDDRDTQRESVVALGAEYQITDNSRAGVNVYRSESEFDSRYRPGQIAGTGGMNIGSPGMGLLPGSSLMQGIDSSLEMQQFDSEMTGIDLEFQVGFSTDRAGDMVLGLQLTRIMDAQFSGSYISSPGVQNWTIAEPLDRAQLSFDWTMGAFSGGIESYYQAPVEFLNRSRVEDYATFDVHFSWRAPWNASLSVGASNVMGAGAEDSSSKKNSRNDPFESIYGRIPYVRYKQDL